MQDLIAIAAGLWVGLISTTFGGGVLAAGPILMALGLDAAKSIGTAKFAMLGGLIASLYGLRGTTAPANLPVPRVVIFTVVGSAIGAMIQTSLPITVARNATLLFLALSFLLVLALDPKTNQSISEASPPGVPQYMAVFALGTYSGFLGAGYGALMMVLLVRSFGGSFAASARAMIIATISSNILATSIFALRGSIDYRLGASMLAASIFGGYAASSMIHAFGIQPFRLLYLVSTALLILREIVVELR